MMTMMMLMMMMMLVVMLAVTLVVMLVVVLLVLVVLPELVALLELEVRLPGLLQELEMLPVLVLEELLEHQ